MTVEELIALLSRFPAHYTVQVTVPHIEADDETAEIVDVTNFIQTKIVELILDGRPT